MACISALSQTETMLAFAEACERNKVPILEVLQKEFAASQSVLEVGSGTGQHAVFLAAGLPKLIWQPTEMPEQLPPLLERVKLEGPANLRTPVALDVRDHPWPVPRTDALFSANTLHIMSWEAVREFFRGAGEVLGEAAVLASYGPFRFRGAYTSDSNAEFDRFLRQRDPHSGIRDFEALDELARAQGLQFQADHPMPANNRTLIWRRL
jgi:cyclopropane fatty-acyl-phospholipid synthase-like methyltransferase